MMAEKNQTIAVLSTDSLNELAFKIINWHRSALSLANESLNYALQCGQALLEAKARVDHGNWLSWREKNIPGVSERQSQVYMRVAKEWDAIKAIASERMLTIEGALSLIATPRARTEAMSKDDEMSPPLEITRIALDVKPPLPSQPNPQATADLNSDDVGVVDGQSLPEMERTDPEESLSQQSPTVSVVASPVIRSKVVRPVEAGEVSTVAEAATYRPNDAQANFARLKIINGNLTTQLSRAELIAGCLAKQIGDHQFVSTLRTLKEGNERLWRLRQDWEAKGIGGE